MVAVAAPVPAAVVGAPRVVAQPAAAAPGGGGISATAAAAAAWAVARDMPPICRQQEEGAAHGQDGRTQLGSRIEGASETVASRPVRSRQI